jgi:hypothetical protein
VFQVQRPGDNGLYALKRLKNQKRADRFDREIGVMRTLAEQGIAAVPPVIENGRDERGRPFFVMPWYSEGSLENLIERGGLRQQYIAGVTMLLAVVDGLASVHDAGWAHRDLKPANILLEKQSPLLADLGLTMSVEAATEDRLTGSNEAVGSRLYIAPENESGFNEEQDQRPADFYAFAKVAWTALVGEAPPAREGQLDPGRRLVDTLSLNEFADLDELFQLLLRPDPRARLQQWGVVTAALSELADSLGGDGRPLEELEPTQARARRAAERYGASPRAYTARLERERLENQNRRHGELRGAVRIGIGTYTDRYEELRSATQDTVQITVAQGHPPLRELLKFEVLQAAGIPDAPSRGLAASLGDGADVVVIAGIGPPPPPPMYLAGYVYIDAQGDSVWLIRLPLLSVGAEVRLLDGLRERFAEIQGPLALESELVVQRAEDFGRRLGFDGLGLAAEYLEHLADDRDLLDSLTWVGGRN